MPDCLFCKIVDKKIPAKVIYENDSVVAFLDIMPRAVGHALVIPKMHAPTLLDLPEEKVSELFAAVKRVDAMLVKALALEGVTIGINQGEASGQEVKHLHVHLLPRWQNDGGGAIQSVVNRPGAESVDAILAKVLEK